MEKLFTVLHRPKKPWTDEEISRLVNNLATSATIKPDEFPCHLILSGHHTRQRVSDVLGKEGPFYDVIQTSRYDTSTMPFIPGEVP